MAWHQHYFLIKNGVHETYAVLKVTEWFYSPVKGAKNPKNPKIQKQTHETVPPPRTSPSPSKGIKKPRPKKTPQASAGWSIPAPLKRWLQNPKTWKPNSPRGQPTWAGQKQSVQGTGLSIGLVWVDNTSMLSFLFLCEANCARLGSLCRSELNWYLKGEQMISCSKTCLTSYSLSPAEHLCFQKIQNYPHFCNA